MCFGKWRTPTTYTSHSWALQWEEKAWNFLYILAPLALIISGKNYNEYFRNMHLVPSNWTRKGKFKHDNHVEVIQMCKRWYFKQMDNGIRNRNIRWVFLMSLKLITLFPWDQGLNFHGLRFYALFASTKLGVLYMWQTNSSVSTEDIGYVPWVHEQTKNVV